MLRRLCFLPLLWGVGLGCPPAEPTNPPPTDESATPSDPVEHAHQLMEQGKPKEAEAVVDDALASAPDNAELWFSKGVAQRAQGNNDGAVTSWEKSLQLDPKQAAARHGLASLMLEAGEYDQAVAAYTELLTLEPDFADGHYNLGLALLGQGNTDAAEQALRNAVQLAPQDPDAVVELGRLLARTGRIAQSIDLVGPVAQQVGNDAGLQAAYAWLLERTRRYDEAARHFEAALAVTPNDDDAKLGLARCWMRLDPPKAAEAVELIADVAKRREDDPALWLAWGTALGKQGDNDGAVEKFDRAIALVPTMQSAHVQKIGALVLAQRCPEAKRAHKVLKKLGPGERAKRATKAALAPCG